jgi:predicted amino acid-binding ACT domain protein
MKCSFEKIQQALIDQRITIEQFIEILIDNYGAKKTRKILRKNLELAMEAEIKRESLV